MESKQSIKEIPRSKIFQYFYKRVPRNKIELKSFFEEHDYFRLEYSLVPPEHRSTPEEFFGYVDMLDYEKSFSYDADWFYFPNNGRVSRCCTYINTQLDVYRDKIIYHINPTWFYLEEYLKNKWVPDSLPKTSGLTGYVNIQ